MESAEAIVERAEEALRFLPPENLFLNPDCGFGTFASRPMNSEEVATRKLSAISERPESPPETRYSRAARMA